jgi:aspartyl protease family protein
MLSGTRSLIADLIGWVAVAALGALAITHYDDIKALATAHLDLPQAGTTQSETDRPQGAAGVVELKMQRNGHFQTTAELNGRSIDVMVDTGATMVALTFEDAERAGIYPSPAEFTQRVSTANGTGRVAPVTIDRLTIGDITVRDVRAAVVERGKLQQTLLGMSFLGRLSRFEMRSGTLILQE